MSDPAPAAPRFSLADVARAQVRQASAAVYALVFSLLGASFLIDDGRVTIVLQGASALVAGWAVARLTEGPWWSWVFTGPWLLVLDLAFYVVVVRLTAEEAPPLLEFALLMSPGPLLLCGLAWIGAALVAFQRRRRAKTAANPGIS